MSAENDLKNKVLQHADPQAVVEKAQAERAKTETDLADARARLEQAQDVLEANVENRQAAVEAAIERTAKLEAELAVASEDLQQAQEVRDRAVTAESLARSTYDAAVRSHKTTNLSKLEKRFEKAQSEYDSARSSVQSVDGNAARARDDITLATAELKDAQKAHDTAIERFEATRAEMDAAAAQYLDARSPESERRYDAALIARSKAESAVAQVAKRLEEAIAQNERAQRLTHLVEKAAAAEDKLAEKKQAYDEARKALNRAASNQEAADNRVQVAEADLETKYAELEAASRVVDKCSAAISEKMDALKAARKELIDAKKALSDQACAESAVAEAQARVDSLSIRLDRLDEIISAAKSVMSE